MPILYAKSTGLYLLIYHVIGYRKKVVFSNLNLVFPEKSDDERKEIAKEFYRHLCDFIFESIKAMTISEKEISKRFVFENVELLNEYHSKNKSVILLCGHYGNWEWTGILNTLNPFKNYAVYKKLDNPYFDKLVKDIRERFGGELISNKKIAQVLFRSYKRNIPSVTLILGDQTPKIGAFKHRDLFMGIDVPVFTGGEELAKKLGFSVFYLKIEKVKRGHYNTTFVPIADNSKEFEDFTITRAFLNHLEAQIRESPPYYLWSHKRWKLRN